MDFAATGYRCGDTSVAGRTCRRTVMETPHIRIESTGAVIRLRPDVTTIGRGKSVDVQLDHPSVSKLHAEIVRRGPYAYVSDLGLSRHGTRVNGKVVAQRLLDNGDVLSFGSQRCRVGRPCPSSPGGRSTLWPPCASQPSARMPSSPRPRHVTSRPTWW